MLAAGDGPCKKREVRHAACAEAQGLLVRRLVAVLNAVLAVSYPAAVYFGLLHWSARTLGCVLLALLLPGLWLRLRGVPREQLWAVLKLPLAVAALVAACAISGDARFVLALPVLVNLALLFGFASSLREVPMIERFARLQKAELGPAQLRYCRTVTVIWCVFFVLNAGVSAGVALWGSLALWSLYTGLIAYVLMGMLGGTEYVVRKIRFREYGSGLHDRLLARVFPPPVKPGGVH
jgi:uncharacterized membrane protein